MRLVIVPGIVNGDAPISCWPLFPMPSNSSELLAKVNSIQFPSRVANKNLYNLFLLIEHLATLISEVKPAKTFEHVEASHKISPENWASSICNIHDCKLN